MKIHQGARVLNPWSWMGGPVLACALATVLFSAPVRLFGLQLPEPVFGLVPAFAWPMIRPSAVAPFVLLALGLFQDLYWGGPVGLWAVALLSVHAAVLGARSLLGGRSAVMGWLWYMAAVALALAVGLFISVVGGRALPGGLTLLWQFLATCALYPFAESLIERFEDADTRFR